MYTDLRKVNSRITRTIRRLIKLESRPLYKVHAKLGRLTRRLDDLLTERQKRRLARLPRQCYKIYCKWTGAAVPVHKIKVTPTMRTKMRALPNVVDENDVPVFDIEFLFNEDNVEGLPADPIYDTDFYFNVEF